MYIVNFNSVYNLTYFQKKHEYYSLFTTTDTVVCYALHLDCYCSTFMKSTQLTSYQNYINNLQQTGKYK